jgi:hypothetical protein
MTTAQKPVPKNAQENWMSLIPAMITAQKPVPKNAPEDWMSLIPAMTTAQKPMKTQITFGGNISIHVLTVWKGVFKPKKI